MTEVLSEHGRLTRVLLKHARDAFVSDTTIASQWKPLNFSAPPDFAKAVAEYEAFLDIFARGGTEVVFLPPQDASTLDSIYVRDASIASVNGAIVVRMGKKQRAGEPVAQEQELRRIGWPIAGSIVPPGQIEGGDLVWIDSTTLAVGLGTRTNPEGIRQLRVLLGDSFEEITVVPLPAYPGQHDVMHLMSLVSPVDKDLAVVYPRLLPERFRQFLQDRGYRFVDVPDDEFETMGTNVLALGPSDCVMVDGNPRTRAALERAGARVQVYQGQEISLKGGGGPTCLTRPLSRVG
jgi:N-dimethylarginine dimethylaminohydrolase